MLKKLLKYEYGATYKLYLASYVILLALALINRIVFEIELSDNVVLLSISRMFLITTILSCIGLYFATLIFSLFRFYKNLFTDEGYLMFTLPVSPLKLIISKIIVGMTWVLSSFFIIAGAITIMLYNTSNMKLIMEIWYFVGDGVLQVMFNGQILQFVLYMIKYIIGVFSTVCFIYLAVAFGQMILPRHKIAGSILSYFMISMISSIISGIVTILYYIVLRIDLNTSHVPSSYYGLTGFLTLGFAVLSIFLINNICKKHLNLS